MCPTDESSPRGRTSEELGPPDGIEFTRVRIIDRVGGAECGGSRWHESRGDAAVIDAQQSGGIWCEMGVAALQTHGDETGAARGCGHLLPARQLFGGQVCRGSGEGVVLGAGKVCISGQ